jgi:DNA modification methylase
MIINANSVNIPLPDNSVQCVVTSPPYWGLRKYDGAQDNIWGGNADCQHEWQTHRQAPSGGRNTAENPPNTGGNFTQQTVSNPSRDGVISSFCQRCGAWRGGLGLEPTPEMFIDHMVQIFREVKRVLRDDGVAWVNMGDSYAGSGKGAGTKIAKESYIPASGDIPTARKVPQGLKPKDLIMIPHRLALALQADGWWVRSDVIWSKNNPMPESLRGWRWEQCKVKVAKSEHATVHNIKGGHKKMLEDASVHQGMSPEFLAVYENCTGCDKCKDNNGLVLRRGSWRPTSSHEHLFMLAKSSMYYSDGESVKEPHTESTLKRITYGLKHKHPDNIGVGIPPVDTKQMGTRFAPKSGRNLRNVWNIPTTPYKGAHYATFPPELARRCVLSSTSRHACSECGMAWSRKLEKPVAPYKDTRAHGRHVPTGNKKISGAKLQEWLDANPAKTLGYMPSCQCDAGVQPCVVLDPFAGSGTVGQVSRELPYQRDFVGLDISYEYLHGQALLRSERITTKASLQELPMFADDNGGK